MRRREVLAALGALVCFTTTAESQALSVGGRLGLTNSAVLFEDEYSNDRIDDRQGLIVGGIIWYELNSILSLQLELSYVQKGWREFGTGGGRKLANLETPLLLVISAPWKTSPHLMVGPSLSYELSCSVTDVPTVGSVSCNDPRVEWDRKKLLVGLRFGLGVGRRLGVGRLDLQLLGDVGLTDLNRESLPPGYTRFVAVMASVAFSVPVGGL